MDPTNYVMNRSRKKADNFVDGVREHGKLVTIYYLLEFEINNRPDFNHCSFAQLQ